MGSIQMYGGCTGNTDVWGIYKCMEKVYRCIGHRHKGGVLVAYKCMGMYRCTGV